MFDCILYECVSAHDAPELPCTYYKRAFQLDFPPYESLRITGIGFEAEINQLHYNIDEKKFFCKSNLSMFTDDLDEEPDLREKEGWEKSDIEECGHIFGYDETDLKHRILKKIKDSNLAK